MASFFPGDRVVHAIHGAGAVVQSRMGRRVLVRFDLMSRMPLTVYELDLQADGPSHAPVKTAPPAPRKRSGSSHRYIDDDRVEASPLHFTAPPRRIEFDLDPAARAAEEAEGLDRADSFQVLEALRLGVVPHHGVAAYTVGRDDETASIARLLDSSAGCRVLWGDYGTGKTHMLEVAEQMARRQGFATARVTLDPKENGLHHPLRLYRRIAEALQLPGSASSGLDHLFEILIESDHHNRPKGKAFSRFYSPHLHILKHGNDEERGWFRDYVHGDPIDSTELRAILARRRWSGANPLAMSDFRTYGRMYAHLVGTLACWLRDAGARGLVVFFDEVERIDVLTPAEQHYALEVLKHYAAITMEPDDLAFAPEVDLYRGGHPVHQSLPLRFRADQPLSAVFALTPLPEIVTSFSLITENDRYDLRLSPLAARDLPVLAGRIIDLYRRSYPGFDAAAQLDRVVEAGRAVLDEGRIDFRGAVRASVFTLDAARIHGSLE